MLLNDFTFVLRTLLLLYFYSFQAQLLVNWQHIMPVLVFSLFKGLFRSTSFRSRVIIVGSIQVRSDSIRGPPFGSSLSLFWKSIYAGIGPLKTSTTNTFTSVLCMRGLCLSSITNNAWNMASKMVDRMVNKPTDTTAVWVFTKLNMFLVLFRFLHTSIQLVNKKFWPWFTGERRHTHTHTHQ